MNLPLPRMILAAAHGERKLLRKRLLALHDMLDQGLPLDTALAAAVPEVSDSIVGSAGSAQRTGRFVGLFRKASARNTWNDSANSNGFYLVYPILFLSLALPVVSMLLIFVVPKFRTILADFHTSMPWSTRLLLSMSEAWGPVILFAGLLGFAAPLGAQLRRLFPISRGEYGLIGLSRDQLLNWLPISRGFLRSRAMSELCDLLATLVENGQPMDQALLDAAESQSNALWAARIRQWAWNIASGQSIQDSARNAKMPPLMVGMISTTSQNTTLAQVLQFLGRYYESRFGRLREILLASYIPVMVLLMAAIVLLIDLSVFQPLIAIDNKAATLVGRF